MGQGSGGQGFSGRPELLKHRNINDSKCRGKGAVLGMPRSPGPGTCGKGRRKGVPLVPRRDKVHLNSAYFAQTPERPDQPVSMLVGDLMRTPGDLGVERAGNICPAGKERL